MKFTAGQILVPVGYSAFVEELRGADPQGSTLEEVCENLKEAVHLIWKANHELTERSLAGQPNVLRERSTITSR